MVSYFDRYNLNFTQDLNGNGDSQSHLIFTLLTKTMINVLAMKIFWYDMIHVVVMFYSNISLLKCEAYDLFMFDINFFPEN
jgi:hypothetical protein